MNPFSEAALTAEGAPTAFDAYTTDQAALRAIDPDDTKFIASDGTRLMIFDEPIAGTTLSQLLAWLALSVVLSFTADLDSSRFTADDTFSTVDRS